MSRIRRVLEVGVTGVVVVLGGSSCFPYVVGSTAQPLRPNEHRATVAAYGLYNGYVHASDSAPRIFPGLDFEVRRGLRDGVSDFGVRFTNSTGVMVDYKRRLNGSAFTDDRAAVSMKLGVGLLHIFTRPVFEFGILASGPETDALVPYGGVRALVPGPPLARVGRLDSFLRGVPLGGLVGVRIGRGHGAVHLELGAYYNHAAPELGEPRLVLVPSITFDGRYLNPFADLLRPPRPRRDTTPERR